MIIGLHNNRIIKRVERQKKIFTILGIAFIGIHFLMIIIYVVPSSFYSSGINKISKFYVDPLFTQHWALFAPEPPMQDIVIEYRLINGNNYTKWINPRKQTIELHNNNRLHPNSKLFRLNQHVGFFLLRDYKDIEVNKIIYQIGENKGVNNIVNSFGYKTAVFYCKSHAKKIGVSNFKVVEIKLTLVNPVPFEQRNNRQILPVSEQINFPLSTIE
jgi:Family of unknown function (DUF5819)